MTRGSVLSKHQPRLFIVNVNAFSARIRIVFVAIVTALVIAELISVPMWPPPIYYPWQILKLTAFVAAGILAPIAFWRFNALNRGLLYAALSAAFVETMQAIVNRGHSGHAFHWYELVVKLLLILFGFSVGLDIRYERQIKLGPFQLVLHGPPLKKQLPTPQLRKPRPHQFVLDALADLEPQTRHMFSLVAVYIGEKIVLGLRDKRDGSPDDGIWLATSLDHHESLRLDFPSMRSISVFSKSVSSWQLLPVDSPDFESAALHACDLIHQNDPRIGKYPKPRRQSSTKSELQERPESQFKRQPKHNSMLAD